MPVLEWRASGHEMHLTSCISGLGVLCGAAVHMPGALGGEPVQQKGGGASAFLQCLDGLGARYDQTLPLHLQWILGDVGRER